MIQHFTTRVLFQRCCLQMLFSCKFCCHQLCQLCRWRTKRWRQPSWMDTTVQVCWNTCIRHRYRTQAKLQEHS